MHLKFGFMNYIFYLGIVSTIIFLPLIGVILSKIVLSFMDLLHQNKELVLTIQHILQFFPEAVLIQTKSNSDVFETKFINEAAEAEILNFGGTQNRKIEDIINIPIKEMKLTSDEDVYSTNDQSIWLGEVFKNHQDLLSKGVSPVTSIKITNEGSPSQEAQFYDVKTIKVKWETWNNSLMHVFLNTTQVKKYEKEKALNKCLQLMFSSVSHEFRTPLNAFSNALNLLEINDSTLLEVLRGNNLIDSRLK